LLVASVSYFVGLGCASFALLLDVAQFRLVGSCWAALQVVDLYGFAPSGLTLFDLFATADFAASGAGRSERRVLFGVLVIVFAVGA